MPIGNLTSQIFANIYLNELDRFVKHKLKIKYYLRYGDDFILINSDLEKLKNHRKSAILFLEDNLKLLLNPKNDKIIKAGHGLRFLGVMMRQDKRILNRRNRKRIMRKISFKNAGSYYGFVKKHAASSRLGHELDWRIHGLLENEF